jgi:microcystin-dependent protein
MFTYEGGNAKGWVAAFNDDWTGSTGGNGPHENMQPFYGVYKLIKY